MRVAIKIVEKGEAGVGVDSLGIEGAQFNWDHVGWAEKLIRYQGTVYIAAQIVAAITYERSPKMASYGHRTIKFGPGGRRLYIAVTPKLVEEVFAANARGTESGYTADQRARAEELVDFAAQLETLLQAEVAS